LSYSRLVMKYYYNTINWLKMKCLLRHHCI